MCLTVVNTKNISFVSQPSNVTFILHTDGVSLFRSSSVDLWLILLAVNELPPKIRYVCNLQYSLSPPLIQIVYYCVHNIIWVSSQKLAASWVVVWPLRTLFNGRLFLVILKYH